MVRFLCGGTNPPGSNHRFDIGVVYLRLIILLVIDDVPVDSEILFNRLCKSQDQADTVFRGAHRVMVYMCIYRSECSFVYEYMYLYII
jgi:hypothetical protein